MKSKKIPTYLKYYLSKTRLDGLVFNKTYLENLSGTSFYLDHSIEDKIKINFKASESTQNSTSGINKFNAGKRTRSQFGITTNYNGSELTINGTNTDAQSIIGFGTSSDKLAVSLGTYPAGSYGFKFEKVSGNLSYSSGASAFFLRKADNTGILNREISSNTGKLYVRFDLAEATEIFIQWYINTTGWTFTNYVCRFMITDGTSEHDYEPYTNGASPNPDYPQEIHVVKGNNTIKISNSDNTETQTYPLSLGNLEMCNINNYADEFFKNVPECVYYDNTLDYGKCYKLGKIAKIDSYNGETITTDYMSTTGGLDIGATVYYVLATPTKKLLSDTLQEELDNINNNAHTYDKITNIGEVNEDRPFILDISYYRKVK